MELDRRIMVAMLICVAFSAATEAAAAGNGSRFDELFQSSWASDHMMYDGELLQLKLDNFSGIITELDLVFRHDMASNNAR